MRYTPSMRALALRAAAVLCLGLGQAAWAASPAAEPLPAPVSNPLRGDRTVIESGRQAFNANCARCHGVDASQPTAEAPDLRRLNGFCNRLSDPALKNHCLSDVDTHFLTAAHEGRIRAGVHYMPAWKGVLSDQTLWEIRSFIESQPLDPPKVRTSVERAAQQRP